MLFKKKYKEIDLFEHPIVNEFERNVADSLGAAIYSENKDIIGNLIREEIEQSKIQSDKLLSYFLENNDQLLKFATRLIASETKIDDGEEYPEGEEISDNEKPRTEKTFGTGIGFGITYAIYYHFLTNNTIKELSDYLKVRRIPHSNMFQKRLIEYFNEINK